jgi:uncharacterized protein YdiU (UPF0061 family)
MGRKIGLASAQPADADLVQELLTAMEKARADFTLTFRALALAAQGPGEQGLLRQLFEESAEITEWLSKWQLRLERESQTAEQRAESMGLVNPEFIPRNHLVQAALDTASDSGDLEPFRRLLGILQRPYDAQPEFADYALPSPSAVPFKTFCGT